jgi:hypothetical protein
MSAEDNKKLSDLTERKKWLEGRVFSETTHDNVPALEAKRQDELNKINSQINQLKSPAGVRQEINFPNSLPLARPSEPVLEQSLPSRVRSGTLTRRRIRLVRLRGHLVQAGLHPRQIQQVEGQVLPLSTPVFNSRLLI